MNVGEKVYRRIEEARTSGVIGKPLEAAVTLSAPADGHDFLVPYLDLVNAISVVSRVIFARVKEDAELQVGAESARGAKCERVGSFFRR